MAAICISYLGHDDYGDLHHMVNRRNTLQCTINIPPQHDDRNQQSIRNHHISNCQNGIHAPSHKDTFSTTTMVHRQQLHTFPHRASRARVIIHSLHSPHPPPHLQHPRLLYILYNPPRPLFHNQRYHYRKTPPNNHYLTPESTYQNASTARLCRRPLHRWPSTVFRVLE